MLPKTLRTLLLTLLLAFVAWPAATARAQGQSEAPYYIVQPGDTLSAIAYRFGVDMQTLAQANGITNPANLEIGQKLVIPGLEGVSGQLSTRTVGFGDSLTGLSRALRLPEGVLARLNRVVSPYQLFAGRSLIVPIAAARQKTFPQRVLTGPHSLLETALQHGQSPWAFVLANQLSGTWAVLPGDVLTLPGTSSPPTASAFPQQLAAKVLPSAWTQGRTGEVRIQAPKDARLSGAFGEHPLHFFLWKAQTWVALQGVFALASPGLYPLTLNVTLPDGRAFHFDQAIRVQRGHYAYERLIVPASLLNPQLNKEEEARFEALTAPATPTRYWQGIFKAPEAPPLDQCHPSYFGTRRNYNDTFYWYHTGLDFCGRVGTPIYAPADGVVVFAGQTEIHGNVTIIDHGWGVYTTYCHQSEILVKKGQRVHTGELIGKVGRTGRVTGPHLHWEVWVGDVPVDPQEWLSQPFP